MNIPQQIDTIFMGITCLISGAALAILVLQIISRIKAKNLKEELQGRIDNARREAENIVKSAQLEVAEDVIKEKEKFSTEANQMRSQLRDQERRLSKREDVLDRQGEQLGQREKQLRESERELNRKKQSCEAKSKQLSNLIAQQKNQLLKITSMDYQHGYSALRGGADLRGERLDGGYSQR
jgi:ribonuclease Y